MKKLLVILTLFCISLPVFSDEPTFIWNEKEQKYTFKYTEYTYIYFKYDSKGRLVKIGDMPVKYNSEGKMEFIGDMPVSYDSKNRISRIGDKKVSYRPDGRIRCIISKKLNMPVRYIGTVADREMTVIGDYHVFYKGGKIDYLVKY